MFSLFGVHDMSANSIFLGHGLGFPDLRSWASRIHCMVSQSVGVSMTCTYFTSINKTNGKVNPGLQRRREAERELFLNPPKTTNGGSVSNA